MTARMTETCEVAVPRHDTFLTTAAFAVPSKLATGVTGTRGSHGTSDDDL